MARTLVTRVLKETKVLFAGEVRCFASTTAPFGFLACDGSPVSRLTYPDLFLSIGTTYGDGTQNADGTASGFSGTHFNLPDYRGLFLRMVDGSKGNDPDKASRTAMFAGGVTGNNVGSVQTDMFAAHAHTTGRGEGSINSNGPWPEGTNNPVSNDPTSTVGGNETRPKNANVLYCIKY